MWYLDSSIQDCGDGNLRSSSAAPSRPYKASRTCKETAWGPATATQTNDTNAHWLTWNTGELEPPGLQTIHARPYPTPEPPSNYGQKGFVSPKLARNPTPKRFIPQPPVSRPSSNIECEGHMTSPAPYPKETRGNNYNASPHPCYRSWHTSGCNGYEAEVTYNMLQHLYGRKSTQLDKMRRNRSGRYEHPINFERKILHGTYKSLERMNNPSASYSSGQLQRAPMDYYPVSYHSPRSGIARPDHTASSFFQYTQPSVKNSFVIHPQWTSEQCEFSKKLKSTKNLSHLTANKGDNSFRYGSKEY
ncbi:uncharacterized protein [Watersipora subatra]|uniref:uncharacterized protein isoform X2 n=1 Tax=Watersipora subatra TaxID=2589382 RepID=UPI00355BCD57